MRVTPRDPRLSLLVVHSHTGRRPRPHSLSRWFDRTNTVGARRSALANFFAQPFASPPRPMPLQVDHVPESPEAEQLPSHPGARAVETVHDDRACEPPRAGSPETCAHPTAQNGMCTAPGTWPTRYSRARPYVDNRRRVAGFDVCEKVRRPDVHWRIMTSSGAGGWGLGAGNAGLGTRGRGGAGGMALVPPSSLRPAPSPQPPASVSKAVCACLGMDNNEGVRKAAARSRRTSVATWRRWTCAIDSSRRVVCWPWWS